MRRYIGNGISGFAMGLGVLWFAPPDTGLFALWGVILLVVVIDAIGHVVSGPPPT